MKALIVAALVVPMTAYVAGSLVSSSARDPADRGPVIIRDAPSPTPPPTATPRRTPTQPTQPTSPTPSVPQDDSEVPIDDNEARVVIPQPTAVDDDDDEDDDRREGDDDDSRTGGDDTDDGDD